MIYTVWDWKRDDNGFVGWLQRQQPHFYCASEGFTMAHDALEHFPSCYDPIADECIALGALLRGRGEACHFSEDPYKVVGTELERFFSIYSADTVTEPRSHTAPLRGDGRYAEEVIQAALDEGLRLSAWSPLLPDDKAVLVNLRSKLASWLRIGYRRCERRYRGATPDRLSALFYHVEEDAKKFLKYGEHGDTLHLAVDPISLSHKFRHNSLYQ